MSSNTLQENILARENARTELELLRQELQELKRCQLQYFTLTVTGTAAILGFAGTLGDRNLLGPSLLAPLVIIIPCWWIFFDKATTITRIVGYVRIIEQLLANGNKHPKLVYPGYEEALTLYRECEDMGKELPPGAPPRFATRAKEWLKLIFLRTRHRYWMINFYTFSILSVLCYASGWRWFPADSSFLLSKGWSMGICTLVLAVSLAYSVITVHQLTFGKRSYEHSAEYWRMALDPITVKDIDERRKAGLQPVNRTTIAPNRASPTGP